MKNTFSTFLMIIGMLLMMFLAWSCITFQMQVSKAQEFHAECIEQIQASAGDLAVLQECADKAAEVTYTDRDGVVHPLYEISYADATVYEELPTVMVKLNYTIVSPILTVFGSEADYMRSGEVQGYATATNIA